MQVEKATIEGKRKVAEADLGPVRYLAPAAVLLLLAATSARR